MCRVRDIRVLDEHMMTVPVALRTHFHHDTISDGDDRCTKRNSNVDTHVTTTMIFAIAVSTEVTNAVHELRESISSTVPQARFIVARKWYKDILRDLTV